MFNDLSAAAWRPWVYDRGRWALCLRGALLAAMATLLASSPVQGEEPVEWLSGHAFRRQLELPVRITWQGIPLRTALENLARLQGVAIMLDRRIDPGRQIEFSARDAPLDEVFLRLAAEQRLGYCQVGDVVYFGPPETTRVLATVAALRGQEIAALPDSLRRRLSRRETTGWDSLSQPRQLLETLCSEAGVRITGGDLVPHDLWPAVSLPPLDFAEQATLLLAGFGLTFELADDGATLALRPLPETAVIEIVYARSLSDDTVQKLQETFPDAEIRSDGERLVVVGRMEDQRLIGRLLAGEQLHRRSTPETQQRYTLNVQEQLLEPLMRELARQLGMEVEFDPALGNNLEQRVSFSVSEVDLGGLLEAALAPAGLRAEVEDETILVLPDEE